MDIVASWFVGFLLLCIVPLLSGSSPRTSSAHFKVQPFRHQIVATRDVDLVLSSGFLAFARQAGCISAIEDSNMFNIKRVVGTSSGSLAGSMLAAGFTSQEISDELSQQRPIKFLSPTIYPRRGVFSMRGVIKHLRTILPKDFSDLSMPLAVGVIDYETKQFCLIDSGDLPEAVAASCAIPKIFKPVVAGPDGRLYADGGVADRTGLESYDKWQTGLVDGNGDDSGSSNWEPRKCLVHLVDSSSRYEAANQYEGSESRLFLKTPRAIANFVSLNDYEAQKMVAYKQTMKTLYAREADPFLNRSRETNYIVERENVYIRKKGRLVDL